jgi:hypothetical protein
MFAMRVEKMDIRFHRIRQMRRYRRSDFPKPRYALRVLSRLARSEERRGKTRRLGDSWNTSLLIEKKAFR